MADAVPEQAEFLLYQGEDGRTRIEVRFDRETAWLSIVQMAELFQRDRSVILRHIANVYDERELDREATCARHAQVQREGDREVTREIELYNLDVIISVGYRVKSARGTQFRIWATQRLREYLIKGFALDDERLKRGGGGNYFDELLARIRDIRSSEKAFWRKVLDIYATSIDYDPNTEASQRFFATIQNKMHWAAHGKTAAEVIAERADATKANMGLTSWAGPTPRKADVAIAKNYLDAAELDALNKIVIAYLDFAEVRPCRLDLARRGRAKGRAGVRDLRQRPPRAALGSRETLRRGREARETARPRTARQAEGAAPAPRQQEAMTRPLVT